MGLATISHHKSPRRIAAAHTPLYSSEVAFLFRLVPEMHLRWKPGHPHLIATALLAIAQMASAAVTEVQTVNDGGPIRLDNTRTGGNASSTEQPEPSTTNPRATQQVPSGKPPKVVFSEFELYVSRLAGNEVRRLGSELMVSSPTWAIQEANRQVPADYIVGIGDELQVTIWGSVDADLRLTVDNAGRIVIPRVGPVVVAGVRYAELNELLTRRTGQVFKNFQLSAALGRLRSIRYYVTGFTAKPGAYTVSSLATVMTGLLQAGGPSAAGSFRQIELRRRGQTVSRFDLYDLIVKGDKSGDVALQADDVLHIGPVGPQVGVLGSVNQPAVVELKDAETVADALAFVGGFTAVADQSRIAIERLSERNDRRVNELQLPASERQRLSNGDVLHAFSGVNLALPQIKQYKRVRVEGEVARPGEYVLPPTSTLQDAIQVAGGLTPQAYVFGTDFSRESVRKTQEENYDRALSDLEVEFTRNSSTQKTLSSDEATAQSQRAAGTSRLIERLRAVRPTGRIVLQLDLNSKNLPTLSVEEGDRLYIPARPNTVGVFGSVFNAGSYLLNNGASVDDVMKLAGGPTRGADAGSAFVIRANGTVVSARQSSSGWFSSGSGLATLSALPGDTIFVPEEMNKTTFTQELKDWTQILYQFGLGAAALKTIKN